MFEAKRLFHKQKSLIKIKEYKNISNIIVNSNEITKKKKNYVIIYFFQRLNYNFLMKK